MTSKWKIAAGGPMIPANYTPEDPLDLQGKQPLFDAMDTQWWTLPPEEGERAVVNAFRATMLSPRMNLKGNAVLYQSLMNVDPHESDPNVYENIIRNLKSNWDQQGQTGFDSDPNDVMSVDSILPGKMQPGIWTNIRRIAALGPYADELYKAAMTDVQQYGGSGQYFRNRILQLNIPGVKAKVASFAWLALAPNSSELGTIDVHMMRHLGEDADSPRNTTHYMALEDQLRQERDDTYGPDTPLSKYQWGVWDKRRTPGFHQDHSPLRPVDPTPYTDVSWAPQPRPPREQQLPEADPNQLTIAKVGWSFGQPKAEWVQAPYPGRFDSFVYQVMRALRLPEDEATFNQYHDSILKITGGLIPWYRDKPTSRPGPWQKERDQLQLAIQEVIPQLPTIQQKKIPTQDLRNVNDQEHADQFYNGIVPNDPSMRSQYPRQQQTASRWSMIRLGGYTLRGSVVGIPGTVQGIVVRPDLQSREEILDILDKLPQARKKDYQQQRENIPEWAINRGGKVADMRLNPDGTGFTYAPGAIYVSEWIDVDDNWLLYHDAVIGIIAGKGGGTSHGVTVARERNLPIIVDAQGYEEIKPGDTVMLDGSSGIIEGNGGTAQQQDQGEAKQAEEPVIAFVWSQGHGSYQPIPTGSGGSAALHREMIAEMRQAQQFNKLDYTIGVVYADGHVQSKGTSTDEEAMNTWLNTILPAKTNNESAPAPTV